jgi:polyferredoxin
MSQNQPPGPPTSRLARGIGIAVLLLIGIVLLLPGLCALGFMVMSSYDDLAGGGLIVLWVVCFAIAFGGAMLIRNAVNWWRTG